MRILASIASFLIFTTISLAQIPIPTVSNPLPTTTLSAKVEGLELPEDIQWQVLKDLCLYKLNQKEKSNGL